MRLNVVRLLKLFFALLFLSCLISLFSFAQSAQPAPQSQPEAQQPAQTHPQGPATEAAPASSPRTAPQAASEQDRPFRRVIVVPQKPQQKPLKTLDDRFFIKDAQGIPLGMREQLEKAMQEAMERRQVQPYRLLAGNPFGPNDPTGSFDRGIYARQADGANVCGSIVSYNFSAGANPQR